MNDFTQALVIAIAPAIAAELGHHVREALAARAAARAASRARWEQVIAESRALDAAFRASVTQRRLDEWSER